MQNVCVWKRSFIASEEKVEEEEEAEEEAREWSSVWKTKKWRPMVAAGRGRRTRSEDVQRIGWVL